MILGINHTGVFWKSDRLPMLSHRPIFGILYFILLFSSCKNAFVSSCSYFMCLYLHICTLNNNHLISLRNSCSLDTSCGRSDTPFLEYNAIVNAR